MSTELNVIPSSALTEQEQADLNGSIDSIIAAYKNNRQEINRLVFESVSAMTDSEGYEQELSSRKGLRRFWGAITGSNKRLQDKINSSRAAAQFAAQTTLQRLSEQNLLTFDLITAVNNKLNASMTAVEGEINQIYAALIQFFKQNRSDMIQLENSVAKSSLFLIKTASKRVSIRTAHSSCSAVRRRPSASTTMAPRWRLCWTSSPWQKSWTNRRACAPLKPKSLEPA